MTSLFQAFAWWGAGKKLGRQRKIDEGKNRAPAPVSPRFFPLVLLFALVAYDLTCSPLSKRLEQASTRPEMIPDPKLNDPQFFSHAT